MLTNEIPTFGFQTCDKGVKESVFQVLKRSPMFQVIFCWLPFLVNFQENPFQQQIYQHVIILRHKCILMHLNRPFWNRYPIELAVYGQEEAIKSVSHMELTLKDTLRLHSSWPPRKAKYWKWGAGLQPVGSTCVTSLDSPTQSLPIIEIYWPKSASNYVQQVQLGTKFFSGWRLAFHHSLIRSKGNKWYFSLQAFISQVIGR